MTQMNHNLGARFSLDNYSWSVPEFICYEESKKHFNNCTVHFNNLRENFTISESLTCAGEFFVSLIYAVPILGHLALLIGMIASRCFDGRDKTPIKNNDIDITSSMSSSFEGTSEETSLSEEVSLDEIKLVVEKETPKSSENEIKTSKAANPNHAVEETQNVIPKQLDQKETTQILDISTLGTSDYKPDSTVIHFFICDYVGGGKASQLEKGVEFFKHYIGKYCELNSNDCTANKINSLLDHFYVPEDSNTLVEIENDILIRLEKNGYVAFKGGYLHHEVGHAIFYELLLAENGIVTFKLTNSGEGVRFHPGVQPKESRKVHKNWRYRTLCFSINSLEDLRKSEVLQVILSFTRPRKKFALLKVAFREEVNHSIVDLYAFLFNAWPGNKQITAENPGSQQRAKSCTILSIKKWVKGNYFNNQRLHQHAIMNFWMSASALADYLANSENISPDFVADAIRKLSTDASKMLKQKILGENLLQTWKDVAAKGYKAIVEARKTEEERRLSAALAFPREGIDLSHATPVGIDKIKKKDKQKSSPEIFVYKHNLPGELPDFEILPKLSKPHIADMETEVCYRLNFFRLLPNCTDFDYETHAAPYAKEISDKSPEEVRQHYFSKLGKMCSRFFYEKNSFPTIHVPDSFLADLANGWLIIYLEAKKLNEISNEVFLEWMNGLEILLNAYHFEYTFDSPESSNRFKFILKFIRKEKEILLDALGPQYILKDNYWDICNAPPDHYKSWKPFGNKTDQKDFDIVKQEQIPEMAHFAYNKMQNFLDADAFRQDWIKLPKKIKVDASFFTEIMEFKGWSLIEKKIQAFGLRLSIVPHFRLLREGLAHLYQMADRHIRINSNSQLSGPKNYHIFPIPYLDVVRWGRPKNFGIGLKFYLDSNKPGCTSNGSPNHYYPEFHLPKTANKYQKNNDLNERIHAVLSEDARPLPFFTEEEEKEFISFVQKDPNTRLPEFLTFAKKMLHKLRIPEYQAVFEHVLFNMQGMDLLEQVFTEKNGSTSHCLQALLFNFIDRGIAQILKKNKKIQAGAAFLLHLQLRLCQIGVHYKSSIAVERIEILFKHWELLIECGKENPVLGHALGKALFAALGSMEHSGMLRNDKRSLLLLAKTVLLECRHQEPIVTNYHYLSLKYGFHAFKALMIRSDNSQEIWIEAVKDIFPEKNIESIVWEVEKNILTLNEMSIDLATRTMNSNDFNMQLVPNEITNETDYYTLFKKTKFLAEVQREGDLVVYSIKYKGSDYQIHKSIQKKDISIYKKFNNKLHKFIKHPFTLSPDHCFFRNKQSWENDGIILIENKKTKSIEAEADENGIWPIKNGKRSNKVLGKLNALDDPLKRLIDRNTSENDTIVWIDFASKKIQSIELPFLGITLKAGLIDEKPALLSTDYPGFSVANTQYVPFLKNFLGYLVLENEKGHKKVLIPNYELEHQEYKPYEEAPFGLRKSNILSEQKITHIVLDLDSVESKPIVIPSPANSFVNVLLVSLYMKTKQYEEALQLIKTSSIALTERPNEKSMQVLKNLLLCTEKDSRFLHPYAVALRLHIWSGISKFLITEKTKENKEILKEDLKLYENLYHTIGKYKVPSNVLKRLKDVIGSEFNPMCEYPSETRRISVPRDTICLIPLRDKIADGLHESPKPISSYTALGEDFIVNFLHYYKIAKTGSHDQKRELRRLLTTSSDTWEAVEFLKTFLLFAMLTKDTELNKIICKSKDFVYGEFQKINELGNATSPSFEEMKDLFDKDKDQAFSEFKLQSLFQMARNTIGGLNLNLSHWYSGGDNKIEISPPDTSNTVVHPVSKTKSIAFTELPYVEIPKIKEPINFEELDAVAIENSKRPIDTNSMQKHISTIEEWAKKQIDKAESKGEILVKELSERLQRGASLFKKHLETKIESGIGLSNDIATIDKALENYKNKITEQKIFLNNLKIKILHIANDTSGDDKITLEFLRDLREPFDIETLMIALGRRDFSAVQNGNPALTENVILDLMKEVGTYALYKSQCDKLERCSRELEKYRRLLNDKSDEITLIDAEAKYFEKRNAERAFSSISKFPHLLIFETLGDLLIRKEQFDVISTMTDIAQGWKLIEARTGFGKSKVLLPLWLLIMSNGKNLAIMTTASALFDQQEAYLQNVLNNAYRFFGVRVDFSRESECSEEDITALETLLRDAQDTRRPVFMHDQTIQNLLILKIKEIAYDSDGSNSALNAFLNLRRYIKQNGILFVDEPQKVLDDSQESNYSLGRPTNFKKPRLLFSLKLYEAFFTLIKGKFCLECWKKADVDSKLPPLISHETFTKEIAPKIIEKLIKDGQVSVDKTSKRYLLGEMPDDEQRAFEESLKKMPDKINASRLRILHDQIYHYLPQTILRNAKEHYEISDNILDRTGIPLEDARTPKKGNEFCSPDQIINFTMQANLANSFSYEFIKNFLENLQVQAAAEMDAKDGLLVSETKAYEKYKLIICDMTNPPKSLLKITEEEIKTVRNFIENEFSARLQFIGLAVLPILRRFEKKAASNPHLLVHCFKNVVGASGTLSMQNFPSKLNLKVDEMAIAKTIISMEKKYAEAGHPAIIEAIQKGSREIIKALPNIAKNASVFIEIGAVLREYPSLLAVAKDILAVMPHFEGVVTFDEKGIPVVLKRGAKKFIPKEQTSIDEKKLFWVYAQKDITGTDAELPPTAEAIVFINEHTTMTKLVQGVGRMRGIHAFQNARLAVDNDSAAIIKQHLMKNPKDPLHLEDIFLYCMEKEGNDNGSINIDSLQLQWNALLENIFWDHALSTQISSKAFCQKFNLLADSLLIENTKDEPVKRPSFSQKPIPIAKALKILEDKHNDKIKKIKYALEEYRENKSFAEMFNEKGIKEDREIIRINMSYPKEVILNNDSNSKQTAETTAEQQNLKEISNDMLLDMQGDKTNEKENENETLIDVTKLWSTYIDNNRQRRPLNRYDTIEPVSIHKLFQHKELKDYLSLFKDLMISKNGAITFEGDSVEKPGWINGYVKPLHYLFQGNDKKWVLIDESEASSVIESKEGKNLWLVNQGFVSKNKENSLDLLQNSQFKMLELEAKIINGDFDFDRDQWNLFIGWIDQKKFMILMQFCEKILCAVRPSLAKSSQFYRLIRLGEEENWIAKGSVTSCL